MGLYLCIFDNYEELDGVEVGLYSDFNWFRSIVTEKLEGGNIGAIFPALTLHSDSDGFWTVEESIALEKELITIDEFFRKLPPIPFNSEWQQSITKSIGLKPDNLYSCFIDVDGEPLIERLINLCKLAQEVNKSILFQ